MAGQVLPAPRLMPSLHVGWGGGWRGVVYCQALRWRCGVSSRWNDGQERRPTVASPAFEPSWSSLMSCCSLPGMCTQDLGEENFSSHTTPQCHQTVDYGVYLGLIDARVDTFLTGASAV